MSGGGGDSGDMRASLLSNTERVERTGRRLNEGLRVAYETEEIGGQILGDLDQQRETIMRSRDRVSGWFISSLYTSTVGQYFDIISMSCYQPS